MVNFSNFKLLAFDMDGTIVDTWPVLDATEAELSEKHGIPKKEHLHVEWEDFITKNPQGTYFDFIKFRMDRAGAKGVTPEQYHDQWREVYGRRLVRETRFKANADVFLNHLKSMGHDMALVTSAPRHAVDAMGDNPHLAAVSFVKTFTHIITSNEVTSRKPDPEPYLLAMERFDIQNPDEVLVFEDSLTGVQAARNAGITNIVVVLDAASNHEREKLVELSKWQITDFAELLPQTKP